jgi:hypothetical protein
VAGDGVSVVEMRMLADIESNFATGALLDFESAGMASSFDSTCLGAARNKRSKSLLSPVKLVLQETDDEQNHNQQVG